MRRKRPLLTLCVGRDYERGSGFFGLLILAPFPQAEQRTGEKTAALLNAKVYVSKTWPWVTWSIYAPDRLERLRSFSGRR